MRSLLIVLTCRRDVADRLLDETVEPSDRGALLAELWTRRDCETWRLGQAWTDAKRYTTIGAVVLAYDPTADRLLAAPGPQLRAALRSTTQSEAWQFVHAVADPLRGPVVRLQGIRRDLVDRANDSYCDAAAEDWTRDPDVRVRLREDRPACVRV